MKYQINQDTIRKFRNILLIWVLVAFLFTISLVIFHYTTPVRVHFINVGQGDSCLIQAGQDGTVLLDGGDIESGELLTNYFAVQNITQLDGVFVSHFHQDHVSGILELIESNFPISKIYISNHSSHTELETKLLHLAKKKNISVTRLKTSQKVTLGKAVFQVLSQRAYENDETLNNMSMILRMDCFSSSFLFTGDIETKALDDLVDLHSKKLDVDVLKVPHHGSDSSANEDFISATTPQYSVINVGVENQYGNPSPSTLALLLNEESSIYRTDRDGTIVMTIGKNGIKNITYSKHRR